MKWLIVSEHISFSPLKPTNFITTNAAVTTQTRLFIYKQCPHSASMLSRRVGLWVMRLTASEGLECLSWYPTHLSLCVSKRSGNHLISWFLIKGRQVYIYSDGVDCSNNTDHREVHRHQVIPGAASSFRVYLQPHADSMRSINLELFTPIMRGKRNFWFVFMTCVNLYI